MDSKQRKEIIANILYELSNQSDTSFDMAIENIKEQIRRDQW